MHLLIVNEWREFEFKLSKQQLKNKGIKNKTESNLQNHPNFDNGNLFNSILTTDKIPIYHEIIVSLTNLLNFDLLPQTNKDIFKMHLDDLCNQFQQDLCRQLNKDKIYIIRPRCTNAMSCMFKFGHSKCLQLDTRLLLLKTNSKCLCPST